MFPHRLPTTLFAVGLLLSTLACSKKAADPTSTGSYKLDGVLVNCQAQARTYTKQIASNVPLEDYVEVDLTTTPQPASGAQVLRLVFHKQVQNSTYIFDGINFYTNGNRTSDYYLSINGGITPTSGSFSGTFESEIIQAGGSYSGPFFHVTEGVFTNVRL